MVASSVPSPVVKTSPEVPDRDRVPWVTDRVTLNFPPGVSATSTSEVEILLELAALKVSVVSSSVDCGPGTELTGGAFTAAWGVVTEAGSGLAPPGPGLA